MTSPPSMLGARRLRELLDRHHVRPRKELGQNFVIDPNTITKIVEAAELSGREAVLEIGAGPGSLTVGLAARARRVIAVEFDRALLPVLREALGELSNVDVLEGDAMKLDFSTLPVDALVGNLPYNIATPLVMKVLFDAPQITQLTVLTQREVGERLVAAAGSKSYGRSSVMVHYFGRAMVAGRVSRRAFYPVPGVDSVIVRIVRKDDLPEVDVQRLTAVVRAAFAHRRKTLRNSLAALLGSTDRAGEVLRRAGIDGRARAEEIDLTGFVEIARALR
jgi:16S rRNA (adenine1518-N6/adenine1519-N6)-dimethyltransferase